MSDNPIPVQTIFETLCGHVAALMTEYRVPGVSVGILHRGEIYTRGLGITNIDHPLLVDDGTLFQIGSITKTFTATLTMQLVEEGLLDLDARVRTYLPDFRVADEEASAAATIRRLLTHNADWEGDFFIDSGAGDDAPARYVAAMADLPQLAPFGTTYSYNNASFYLLGHIIETVAGKPYPELLADRLLGPLGLDHAYFRAADVMTHRFAVGHAVDAETGRVEIARPWPLPRAADPVGGMATTPAQLLEYARFQMGDGRAASGQRLLSAASMAQMQRPHCPIWGEAEAVGLSWMLDRRDGVATVSHTGGTVGQISAFTMAPERNFALVVLTNGPGGLICRDAYRWAVSNILGCTPYKPTLLDAPAETLAAYAGHYERPFADLDIEADGGRLILRMTPKQGFPSADTPVRPSPPPASCALCEPDRLLVLDGPMKHSTVDFIRDRAGAIGWARLGRIHRRIA